MARRASAESVRKDIEPPNYEAANRIITEDILAAQQRSSVISGNISSFYKRIENERVDKTAARIMVGLYKLERQNRSVVLRSLFGMLQAAGDEMDVPTDLVDLMQGTKFSKPQAPAKPENVVPISKGKGKGKDKAVEPPPPPPEGDTDLADAAEGLVDDPDVDEAIVDAGDDDEGGNVDLGPELGEADRPARPVPDFDD